MGFKKNMDKVIVYWTDKEGNKIDIDTMSIEYLRNTLKYIVRNTINRKLDINRYMDPDDDILYPDDKLNNIF
jgi:hypothetical protein